MRVQFQMSGGIAFFPGLAKPLTLDLASLGDAVQSEVGELVRNAHFFDLPSDLPAPPGAADHRTYTITIDDAGRSHTVKATDASAPPELQALIAQLRKLVMQRR